MVGVQMSVDHHIHVLGLDARTGQILLKVAIDAPSGPGKSRRMPLPGH